ncbi:cell division protein FtsZ [Prosthecobacter sp.]|uniref:cell division protein FtsZ n=1 Tax=Prosthecobacter sp. TaxID=1965333 RepID=UPI00248A2339|nr:cell division protein FtsZ [Prosthecobacter sp.]MDI1313568.1 cell division protein FtsZ [Prosthecobacter sp.]
MVEYDRSQSPEGASTAAPRICIVGIGGAGSNVVDRITLDRIVDATLVCAHTDVRVLGHSMAPVKIQLGAELMKGIGAGGDPDLGREAALFSREQIRQAIENHDIIFISAGLGGGTGSGAAPVIAEIAKNTGALVLVVATMPFSFEGRRRLAQAEEALELLQKRADALVLFENNRMGELILPKDGIQKAFNQADQLIAQSLRAISTITTTPGLVKLGLDDLTSALANANGRCLFGFGEARGQNRGTEALKKALKSPLIDSGRLLHQTKNLLVHVAGGESLTLVEVEGVMKQLGRHVPDQTHILFGLGVDAKLGDAIAVTLISSLGLNQLNAHATAAPPSEMLQPRAEAPAPAPAPKREIPVKKASSPYAPPADSPPDLLFKSDEFAPAPSIGEAFPLNNFHQEVEKVQLMEQPLAHVEEPPAFVESPAFAESPAFVEPPPPPVIAATPETVRIPVRTPAAKELADAARSSKESTLAAVVARSVTLQTEAAPAQDDLISFDEEPESTMISATTAVIARKPATDNQQTFSLGEEDRGRFKDTEPSIVQGEDLDVPTWMRLKKKLRR